MFGALPAFPNIGGAAVVTGWGSAECGTCWELSWTSPRGVDYTVNVLTIDHATEGFNIAHEAMNTLTGGEACFLGSTRPPSRSTLLRVECKRADKWWVRSSNPCLTC